MKTSKCNYCGYYTGFMASGQACPRCGYQGETKKEEDKITESSSMIFLKDSIIVESSYSKFN